MDTTVQTSRWDTARSRPWQQLVIAAVLLATTLLYVPICMAAGAQGKVSGDYSHVFLMPVLAAFVYLFSERRSTPVPGHRAAYAALWLAGLLLYAVGSVKAAPLVVKLSLPLSLYGAVATLFGGNEAARFRVPLVLLLFAIGLPTDLLLLAFAKGLSLVAAGVAHDIVTGCCPSSGPYLLRQSTIVTRGSVFDVAQSCSGTRWLVALLILGTLVAWHRRLNTREGLRFGLTLMGLAVTANIARIAVTLISALKLGERYTFDAIHGFWNMVIVVACIVMLPFLAARVRGWSFHASAVRLYALLVVIGFAATMYLKAAEGTPLRVTVDRETGQRIVQVVDGLPTTITRVLREDNRDWRARGTALVASGFVHAGTRHAAVNLAVIILVGLALRQTVSGCWWPAVPLLTGQIVSVLFGRLQFARLLHETTTRPVLSVGASGAASGLFGALLVALLWKRRHWGQALFFGAAYLLSIGLEAMGQAHTPHLFSATSHLAAVATGALVTVGIMRAGKLEWGDPGGGQTATDDENDG